MEPIWDLDPETRKTYADLKRWLQTLPSPTSLQLLFNRRIPFQALFYVETVFFVLKNSSCVNDMSKKLRVTPSKVIDIQ